MKILSKILVPIAVLALGFGARSWLLANPPQQPESVLAAAPAPVVVVIARPTVHRREVIVRGELRPTRVVTLAAEIGARLIWISPGLEEGAAFDADAELARLDPTDAEQALAVARAERARAEAALAIEFAMAESARADWEEIGVGEPSALALREPQIALAEAAVAAARAGVARAETALARCTVRAPFAGRCARRHAVPGAILAPGAPIALLHSAAFEARVALAPDQLEALGLRGAVAQPLAAEVESVLGAKAAWPAALVRLEAEVSPRERTLGAVLRLEPSAGAPTPAAGEFVRARMRGPAQDGLSLLPPGARAPDGSIWLVVDGRLRAAPPAVSIVAETESGLWIAGFSGGEAVCITPPRLALDGMPVVVAETR